MNWLHYLLEANIYLAVFYAGYCLFLNKETYYTLNRVYLLLSCLFSFLLPLVQVGILKRANEGVVTTVLIVPTGLKPAVVQTAGYLFSWQNVVLYTYLLGVIVLAAILLFKLFKLAQMTRSADTITNDKFKIVSIEGVNTAFSFFNYLFIGSKTTGSNIIIRHELVHIRQKHTLDVLFLEVIKIINWFNPLIYLMQNSLKTVHEYIADEHTAAFENDPLAYSSFLVSNAYGLNGSPVTNSFFNYNLLKKRIIMLNQKRSGNLARLKYLVAVPICATALCASTLGFSKNYALVDLAPQHVAIDSARKAKPSKIQYLPPPIMVKNGYSELDTHLNKTEKYPAAELKNNQSGLVIVAFKVGADHKISNTQIVKSTGNAFSEAVLASFKSFNGSVTDKAGEHKLAISFFTDYYGQASKYEADIQKSGAEFNTFVIGSLGSTVPPPPVPNPGVTPPKKPTYIGKQKMPPPPPPVPPASAIKEIRINKKSKATPKVEEIRIGEPAAAPEEIRIDEKPAAPNAKPRPAAASAKNIKFPPPAVKVQVDRRPPPPPPADPFENLYKYIARYVRYPKIAYDNHIGGRVILAVSINNGKITDVKLIRPLYDNLDAEVIRVLKDYNGPIGVKSGYYSMPVAFSLLDEQDNEAAKAPENYTSAGKLPTIGATSPPTISMNQVVIVGYVTKKS